MMENIILMVLCKKNMILMFYVEYLLHITRHFFFNHKYYYGILGVFKESSKKGFLTDILGKKLKPPKCLFNSTAPFVVNYL